MYVNNQGDPRQILPVTTNSIRSNNAYQPARNGSLYVQNQFGPYNPPTVPVQPGQVPYGAPLPNNRFPINVQHVLPLFLLNDGAPQGSSQQLQHTFGRWGGIWNTPVVPIKRPLRTNLV